MLLIATYDEPDNVPTLWMDKTPIKPYYIEFHSRNKILWYRHALNPKEITGFNRVSRETTLKTLSKVNEGKLQNDSDVTTRLSVNDGK